MVAAPEATPVAIERPPVPNRCLPAGMPKSRPPRKVYSADTCVDHRRMEALVAHRIKKRFERTVSSSVVDVSFACDPLTSELEEIVIERGWGHGGSLQVWRIRKRADDSDYDVLVLGHASYYRSDKAKLLEIGRGKFTSKTLALALAQARPALTATPRELEPPPPPNGMLGRSFTTSSGDFHHAFQLFDGMHELRRHFTGYQGTGGQSEYLGLMIAMDAFQPLLDSVKVGPDVASAEEQAFFVESFLRAAPRFDDDYAWWVRDRYVKLAEELGTNELVPALVDVLRSGLREGDAVSEEARQKELYERRLTSPLAALVKITGWDPAKEDGSSDKSVEQAARAMVDECSRVLDRPRRVSPP